MKRLLILAIFAISLLASCNKDDVITTKPLPVITLDDEDGVYTLKQGATLTITPTVTDAESYAWILDGEVVANTPSYTFTATEVGTFYLTLRATNSSGKREEQMRIEVLALQPPIIGFALDTPNTMKLAAGREYTLSPEILHAEGATIDWQLDGKSVCTEPTYTCTFDSTGEHQLTLTVKNEDGTATQQLNLQIVSRIPGNAYIPTRRYVSLGRTLQLTPTLDHFSAPTYRWAVDGRVASNDKIFAFAPTAEGDYNITLTLTDTDGYTLTQSITVTCCAAEGTFRRTADATSKASWSKLYEYLPAPGQFINEDKSGFDAVATPADALAYAEKRLTEGKYLSLGGWGGYLVVGFDHSIEKTGGSELSIAGNMFTDSSEAGIVWVMQDTNGNGEPDDEWYELRGSEWGKETHTQHYAVTYYRPVADGMGVQWRDNNLTDGRITRNPTHTQPHYYPTWLSDEHYTLYGSRLAHNTTLDSSGKYVNNPYSWGYADNAGTDADTTPTEGNAAKCHLKISNAVHPDGTAADLQYIDFVKVQSAINYTAGALGEISTEVMGIEDENL